MRTKLQRILNRLDGTNDKTLGAIRDFEAGVKTLREKLQQNIEASTIEEVNLKINKLRKSINLDPIVNSLESLTENFQESVTSLLNDIESKSSELKSLTTTGDAKLNSRVVEVDGELSKLRADLNNLIKECSTELNLINNSLGTTIETSKGLATKDELKSTSESKDKAIKEVADKEIKDVKEIRIDMEEFRKTFLNRLAEKGGGGNMNRQIVVGGNPSTLGKYTDINIKAGSNMTITYTNNDTTKRTDITFTSSGGGGSVGGTVRSINNVSTSQAMGSTAGTDYVYIASAGIKLDLPTATSNTNLYTIKNISNSSVLVSGTIDGDAAGVIMPIKYTSVDIISNDTDWNIT